MELAQGRRRKRKMFRIGPTSWTRSSPSPIPILFRTLTSALAKLVFESLRRTPAHVPQEDVAVKLGSEGAGADCDISRRPGLAVPMNVHVTRIGKKPLRCPLTISEHRLVRAKRRIRFASCGRTVRLTASSSTSSSGPRPCSRSPNVSPSQDVALPNCNTYGRPRSAPGATGDGRNG